MSRFAQRHYNEVAAVLSRAWTRANEEPIYDQHTEKATVSQLVADFSAVFAKDNERFKPELFAKVSLTNIEDIKRKLDEGDKRKEQT